MMPQVENDASKYDDEEDDNKMEGAESSVAAVIRAMGASAVEDKKAVAAMGYNSNVHPNIVIACFFAVVVVLLQ
eukprot:7911082-Ditylum_brightwellii.AAC.1